jgi:hypothetical protein
MRPAAAVAVRVARNRRRSWDVCMAYPPPIDEMSLHVID